MTGYLARLLRAHAQGAFKPGAVTVLTIAHAPACKRPKGGPCTCQPDMTATSDRGAQHIDLAGVPSRGGQT